MQIIGLIVFLVLLYFFLMGWGGRIWAGIRAVLRNAPVAATAFRVWWEDEAWPYLRRRIHILAAIGFVDLLISWGLIFLGISGDKSYLARGVLVSIGGLLFAGWLIVVAMITEILAKVLVRGLNLVHGLAYGLVWLLVEILKVLRLSKESLAKREQVGLGLIVAAEAYTTIPLVVWLLGCAVVVVWPTKVAMGVMTVVSLALLLAYWLRRWNRYEEIFTRAVLFGALPVLAVIWVVRVNLPFSTHAEEPKTSDVASVELRTAGNWVDRLDLRFYCWLNEGGEETVCFAWARAERHRRIEIATRHTLDALGIEPVALAAPAPSRSAESGPRQTSAVPAAVPAPQTASPGPSPSAAPAPRAGTQNASGSMVQPAGKKRVWGNWAHALLLDGLVLVLCLIIGWILSWTNLPEWVLVVVVIIGVIGLGVMLLSQVYSLVLVPLLS